MKTQILHLETHDDVISILDKVKWSQTPRILLVWPNSRQPTLSKIDLLRIQRQSDRLGGQIAIVSSNNSTRQCAKELGIPLFYSVKRAQSTSWARTLQYHRQIQKKIHEREREKIDFRQESQAVRPAPPKFVHNFWFRLVTFTIGVAAFLSIGAVFLPSATIAIEPQVETLEQEFEVQASIEVPSANISGYVPIYQETTIVEGRGSITTTGEIEIPDRYARGEVIFTNLTGEPIELPQGLIVATLDEPPLRYLTLEDVRLVGQLNYSTTASIQALNPGIDYNVPEQRISAVEDPQGLNIQVNNLEPIIGGSYVVANSPTAEDRQRLFDQILEELQDTAQAEIFDGLQEDDILLSRSLEVIEIQQESYTPAVDEPADELSLILRIEFASFVVRGVDLETLGRQVLLANLPEGYQPIEDSVELENVSSPIFSNQTDATWNLRASWEINQHLERSQVVEQILGKTPEETRQILRSHYSLESTPEIRLTPEWWPFMPMLPFSIQFELE